MTASPDVVRTIVFAVAHKHDGAVFADVAEALPPATTSEQVREWISELIGAGILEKDPATHRYFAMEAASAYLDTKQSATGTSGADNEPSPMGTSGSAKAATRRTRRTPAGSAAPSADASAEVVPVLIDTVVRRAIAASASGSSTPAAQPGSAPTPTAAVTPDLTKALSKLLSQWVGQPGSPSGVAKLVAGLAVILAIPAVLQVVGTSPWLTIAGALVVLALVLVIGPRVANRGTPPQPGTTSAAGDNPAGTSAHVQSPIGTSGAEDVARERATYTQAAELGESSATAPSPIENRVPSAARSLTSNIENPFPASSRRVRFTLAAACLLVVAAIVSVVWFTRARSRPPASEVSAYLVTSLAPLPVRVATLDLTFSTETSTGCRITYRGVLQSAEPLFRRLEASAYLSQHFAPETSAIESAGVLLRGPDGARIRSFLASAPSGSIGHAPGTQSAAAASAGPGATNADASADKGVANLSPLLDRGLGGLVLVTTQTPPGAAVTCSGVLVAWRQEGRWMFTSEATNLDRTRLSGDRKPVGTFVFAVDFADDLTRLRTLLEDAARDAARVDAAASAAAAHVARDRQQRVDSLGELLRPGTLFAGTYVDSRRGDSYRVVLEITDASSATRKIAALLRNDGGWADARMFSGEWTVDPDGEACAVTLRTRRDDRIVGAGPLLEEAQDASMVLHVRQDGQATANDGKWRLQRVASEDVEAVKADIMQAVVPALQATRVGTVYRGTATSKATRSVETLVLRFVEQERDGAVVRATLRPEFGDGPERPFGGRILDNTYRGAGNPIRLQSSDAQAVAATNTKSLLAFRSGAGVSLDLRVDGTRLVGESGWFTYEFDRLEGERQLRISETGLRKGEGEARTATDAGPGDPAVHQTDRVERKSEGGSSDAAGTVVTDVKRTAAGPVAATRGDGGAASAAAAGYNPFDKLRAGDPAVQPSQPAYPTTGGVYVLSGGLWKALPGSKGTQVKAAAKGVLNFVSDLNLLSNSEARRKAALLQNAVTEITFSDPGPVPTAKAGEVVIVYVGGAAPVPAEVLAQHPELRTYPAIEMAPARTLPTGARYAPIGAIVPGFTGFGADRVAATLEQPAAGLTVLRCTAPLPRGRYVVLCGGRGYEVGVE